MPAFSGINYAGDLAKLIYSARIGLNVDYQLNGDLTDC